MPLARSNTTRSKSHSPAPDFKHPKSPRPFLPPSHYAAAAGIPYSSRSTARSDSGSSSDLDASFVSKESMEDPPYNYNSFMPISYPTALEISSDSSFEFRASSSRHGNKSSSSRGSSIRSKRQSQMAGLPLLEAQLLPSLRDTIDRMTRSPVSAASSPSPVGVTRPDNPAHSNNVRSTRSSSLSSDPPASTTSQSDTSTTPTSSHLSFAYTRSTPDPISFNINSSPMAPVENLTPRSKLPSKSALKSALRPPTPKLFSTPSPIAEAPPHPHSGGVSLKSVRNILCRKLSSGSLSSSSTSSRPTMKVSFLLASTSGVVLTYRQSPNPQASSSSRHMRKRSCTDPGSLSSVEALSPLDDSNTPVIRQTLRTPRFDSNVQKSNIPRPQARTLWSSRSQRTEDSDLECRYEADGRDRRRLVVANAEVIPSSSESDVDNGKIQKVKDNQFDKAGSQSSAEISRSNVGLGFDIGAAVSKARGRLDSGGQRQQEARQSDQDSTWNSRTPTLPARGMRLNDSRVDRDDVQPRGNTRDSNSDFDEEHQRRRTALLGIVRGLGLGSGIPVPVSGENEESKYNREKGYAMSGSREFTDRIVQHEEPDGISEDGSVYGDGDDDDNNQHPMDQRQDQERPRSSSCMPTFLLSTEDSDDNVHGHGRDSDAYLPDPHLRKPTSSRSSSPHSRTVLRASSRSPIIRNENTNIPIPAALRRHSVYHRSPSPHLYPDVEENTTGPANLGWRPTSPSPRFNQAENQSAAPPAHGQPRVRSARRDRVSEQSDAVLIAERSHAAAARERRAFGIPPSESVEVYQPRVSQLLSHAESNLSSVGSVYWHEEEEELSPGAETLFRKLSGKEVGRRSQSQQVFKFVPDSRVCLTDFALRTTRQKSNNLVLCH
jgi:hypothetical protein